MLGNRYHNKVGIKIPPVAKDRPAGIRILRSNWHIGRDGSATWKLCSYVHDRLSEGIIDNERNCCDNDTTSQEQCMKLVRMPLKNKLPMSGHHVISNHPWQLACLSCLRAAQCPAWLASVSWGQLSNTEHLQEPPSDVKDFKLQPSGQPESKCSLSRHLST